jgi:hypothetical protein
MLRLKFSLSYQVIVLNSNLSWWKMNSLVSTWNIRWDHHIWTAAFPLGDKILEISRYLILVVFKSVWSNPWCIRIVSIRRSWSIRVSIRIVWSAIWIVVISTSAIIGAVVIVLHSWGIPIENIRIRWVCVSAVHDSSKVMIWILN